MIKQKSTPYVDTYRDRQLKAGRKPRQYYVSKDEHEYLKKQLKQYRETERG